MTAGSLNYFVTTSPVAKPFGPYFLLERIGAGGMAEVFRAVAVGPEGFQRTLVIKRILPHLSSDESFVRMFIDEAKLSGLLSHPNLVQVHEFGKVDDCFFIAMEHIHGRTLSRIQSRVAEKNQTIPIAATLEIVRQVCVGLEYAHSLRAPDGSELGIVHRDISPTNLMLAFHGGVKILDFGIARVADGLRENRTTVGSLKGKIAYMSPEQIRVQTVDHRADIFSVGVVLHEMLTGRRLFRGASDLDAGTKVLEMVIPPPSLQNPIVPPEVDALVLRALERNPADRYATAGEMANDLEQLLFDLRLPLRQHLKLLDELFPDDVSTVDGRPMGAGAADEHHPSSPSSPSSSSSSSSSSRTPRIGPLSRPSRYVTAPKAEIDPHATAVVAPKGDEEATAPGLDEEATAPGLDEEAAPPGMNGQPSDVVQWESHGSGAAVVVAPRRFPWQRISILALERRLPWRRIGVPALSLLGVVALILVFRSRAAVERPGGKTSPSITAASTVPSIVHWSIDSGPRDAEVIRADSRQVVGRTPLTVVLPRSEAVITLRFDKAGYEPALYKATPNSDRTVYVDLVEKHDRPGHLRPVKAPVNAKVSVKKIGGEPSVVSHARARGGPLPSPDHPARKDFRELKPVDPFAM